jgi:hypothetical protein
MQLQSKKIALAAAGTGAVLYLGCAIFIAIAPGFSVNLFNYLLHGISFDTIRTPETMTVGRVLIGLIQVIIYTYLLGWIFAGLYNKLTR